MPTRVLYCLSVAVVLAFAAPDVTHAQRINRLANKAFELGNYAEAAEGYEKVLRKSADDAEAHYRNAYALRVLGRLSEAVEAIEAVPAGEDPEVFYQHALILTELGRYEEAVAQVFEAARRKHPKADALATRLSYAQAHAKDLAAWKVSNEFANASGDDFAPEAFGDFVVFGSARNGNPTELYRSIRDENRFLRVPERVHRLADSEGGEAPVAYAPSGELIAYTRNNFEPGERLIPEAGWELNVMLALPTQDNDFLPGKAFVHNGVGYNTGFPSFSPDGTRIYFASDRPGGQGGYDLYYSERDDSGWAAPVNLGPEVNTPGNEIAPQTASGSVYFSSDYLPGFGGMDIYRADMVGGVVSSVSNLGPAVNSPMDDVGFSLAEGGDIAYLASNRSGGKGGMDLYRAVRSGQAITLAVVDGKTRRPIPNAVLDFSDCGQGVFLTGTDGAYTFRALPTLDCRPVVRKSGYNAKQFSVVAANLKDRPRMEIVLNGDDRISVYEGKVVHSRTGDPLAGVKVFARHKSKDFNADARTDANGNYELSLERAGEYAIAYVADAMAFIDREISTYDSDGSGVLSTFAMFPAGKGPAVDSTRQMTVGSTTEDGPAVVAPSTPAPAAPPVAIEAPAERSTPVAQPGSNLVSSGTVAPGVAVQVAAIASSSADLSAYRTRLSQFGEVYGKVEGPLMRVRVGPFDSRDAAVARLAQIRSAGYADAFLASESGGAAAGLEREPGIDRETLQPKGTGYLLRLATYSSLKNFDQAKAAALGDLTTRRSNGKVVVLLQGYATEAEARDRLDAVRRGGYPDAVIVTEGEDGTLTAVR